MKYTQSLPEPAPEARLHSEKLIHRIHEEINAQHGSITFRRYMEMALYEPGLGYYVAGSHKIGESGDFITAPEISSLFSACIAHQYRDIKAQIEAKKSKKWGGCILELGAGSGIMATDILRTLEQQNKLPDTYFILDLSPDLKHRQRETLQKHVPHLLNRVQWLSALPQNFDGMIIGNEVLDAMPVDVFTQHKQTVYEHHIIWENGQLREQLQAAGPALKDTVLSLNIPDEATPYTSEINPNLNGWFDAIANSLQTGALLLIDYGYPRSEYYLHERNKGTLICHYQHRVHEAPLLYPGLQDITASVDFSAVTECAQHAGFSLGGFTSQAAFLANNAIEHYFMQALADNPDKQYKLAQEVRTLSLPSEMGERFKVIGFTKNMDMDLSGFHQMDQRYRL